MDFYDSIFQYDLEIENKITKRLNNFLKFINLLKNENPLNISNTGEMKYNHITDILEEIKNSTKFKSKLFINKKKNLLLRMNNKTKVNSKYYIYAKNMSQNNHKMDIIEVKNNLSKKDESLESNDLKREKDNNIIKIFNQKNILLNGQNDENKNNEMFKSDVNKIVCDMIKQNVKNIYKRKINDIISKNKTINNNNKEKSIDNSDLSINKNKEIKNNNYIKIDISKKEEKEKERKIHSNHSSEKNNFMKYLMESKKNTMNKDLRNSVTNNNGTNLKIKVCSDMLLNFNNLNNGNTLNNLLIVNKKVKSVKNDNYNHNMKIKKRNKENEEQKDIMDYTHKKNVNMLSNNNINKSKISEIEEENDIKLGDQTHKKIAVRNMQRIHIKNVKLKNNQTGTGYNLTNFRKKQISDLDNININSNNKNYTKKNKQKNINFASPSDFIIDGKKLNMLKFKLGKNYVSPNRKITEKSIKRNNDMDNSIDKENSIISLFDNKTKDNFSNGIKFNSVRKKKLSDEMSCNELSQILKAKKNNNENNFPIRNYKTNFNLNNININNINNANNLNNNISNNNNNIVPYRKESEVESYMMNNRNNLMKKSLSKEPGSQSQFPWNFSNSNTNTIMNKSNNKGNIGKTYLNQILQAEKKNNPNINMNNNFENNLRNEKKININKNNNIYKDIAIKQKKGIDIQYIYEQKQEKSAKNRKLRNNLNNFGKNDGYHDTIDNKGEPSSYRGVKIKGKKRILSTRVHIRGIKSSKNFNDVL
jgi:hypothetical protein